jgi:ankyrin repeat protein
VVHELLRRGASVDMADNDGSTLLHFAALREACLCDM